jgi:nitrate/nitrite transporter NarK
VGSGGPLWILLASFIVFNTMVNMGPNATTYLLPAEVFPTRLRATGHGVAAAAGKVGAVVGTFLLPVATASVGLSPTIGVIAVLAGLGAVVTFVFRIETRGRELRD